MWTKLVHTSIHMKHITITNCQFVGQKRYAVFAQSFNLSKRHIVIGNMFSECKAIYFVCVYSQIEHKSLTLGEVLDGDRMAVSLYEINFKRKFLLLHILHNLTWNFYTNWYFWNCYNKMRYYSVFNIELLQILTLTYKKSCTESVSVSTQMKVRYQKGSAKGLISS